LQGEKMAALEYKLQFSAQAAPWGDPAVFIHLKYEPANSAYYTSQKQRHDYTGTIPLVQDILAVDGVTGICSQAYRIWITKSLTHLWEDIIPQVLDVIATRYGLTGVSELPGSQQIGGPSSYWVVESDLRSLY
jgi:hypothetical protein